MARAIKLPTGQKVVPHVLRCAVPGCRKRKSGYLVVERTPGGQFLDKRGKFLADLREVDFVCSEHGIADGSAPFLYPDKDGAL